MTRVSENSNTAALKFAVNKIKKRMEDLQLKGSTLKSMTRPSDNPIGNVEALTIGSELSDNKQYLRNADYALLNLNVTEKAVEQLTEIIMKAKEIAIAQASDFYDADIRRNVANEVVQLRKQALAIGNKRVGQRYLFGGFKTLDKPFDDSGKYYGDTGVTTLEVAKDFFVPVNVHGMEMFFTTGDTSNASNHPLNKFPEMQNSPTHVRPHQEEDQPSPSEQTDTGRDLASESNTANVDKAGFSDHNNVFAQLEALSTALENNDAPLIQNLLVKFDDTLSRLITLRTRIGSVYNSVMSSKNTIDSNNIDHAERRSKLIDADIAELFADIQKQQSILKTTYQATNGIINQTLLDFIR